MILKAAVFWSHINWMLLTMSPRIFMSVQGKQSKTEDNFDFPPDSAEKVIINGKWVFLWVNIPTVILPPTELRFACCSKALGWRKAKTHQFSEVTGDPFYVIIQYFRV